jgi:hypothetical protein
MGTRKFSDAPASAGVHLDGLRTPTTARGHYGINEVKLRAGRIVREGLKSSLTELRLRKASPSARKRWDVS